PDRFVIMGYRDGRQIFRQAGAQIPDPLILGPDPQKLDSEYKQQQGELQPGPDFAWASDFEEAVTKGMAIRIPLDRATAASGEGRVLVMGVRLSSSAAQSQALVEELLDNHHFSSDGLSILPQGTPTNNTDGESSGFSSSGLKPAESFATELGAALFEPASLPT